MTTAAPSTATTAPTAPGQSWNRSPGSPGKVGRPARNNRRFSTAVFGSVSFQVVWLSRWGYNASPAPHGRCAAMGLLHHLESQLEPPNPCPTPSRPPTSPG